jgi:hypothetical protein
MPDATLLIAPGWSGSVDERTCSTQPRTSRSAADPLRALLQHRRALFDADGRDDHAGRAHPRAPRRDASGGRSRARRAPRSGDVSWVLNDPYAGGTHLPDITVITPTFDTTNSKLIGFAASRAHHADVGGSGAGFDAGRQPRSMMRAW